MLCFLNLITFVISNQHIIAVTYICNIQWVKVTRYTRVLCRRTGQKYESSQVNQINTEHMCSVS